MLAADADVIGHINGGHTALPDEQIVCLCERCSARHRTRAQRQSAGGAAGAAYGEGAGPARGVILGTDSPAGSGVQPLGVLRMIAMLSSLGEVPAEQAFCFATGNTARIHGLTCGLIEPGRACDLVFLDRAQHSAGGFTA